MQVPIGGAEDRVTTTQKEGRGTKDKVCQLHANPKEGKETRWTYPAAHSWVAHSVMVTLKETLL